jgi:hypothetical protein
MDVIEDIYLAKSIAMQKYQSLLILFTLNLFIALLIWYLEKDLIGDVDLAKLLQILAGSATIIGAGYIYLRLKYTEYIENLLTVVIKRKFDEIFETSPPEMFSDVDWLMAYGNMVKSTKFQDNEVLKVMKDNFMDKYQNAHKFITNISR